MAAMAAAVVACYLFVAHNLDLFLELRCHVLWGGPQARLDAVLHSGHVALEPIVAETFLGYQGVQAREWRGTVDGSVV